MLFLSYLIFLFDIYFEYKFYGGGVFIMSCGIVVAMEEEAINIKNHLENILSNYEFDIINEKVCRYQTKDRDIYIIVSGIGMNNAIIACSRLVDWFHCTEIYNIGTCGCIKSNYISIGDVKHFDKNIINYAFKLHPSKYRFDDCNINDEELCRLNDLLVTCSNYGGPEILKNNDFDFESINNVFVDMEGYGVAAFCSQRDISYEIIKVVSDFGDEDIFDENVESFDTYNKLQNSIRKIITGGN